MEFQGGVSRNVMVVAVGEFVPSCERLLTCLKNLRRLNEFYMNDFIHFGYDMVDPSCAVASDLDLDIHTCKRKGALVLCRTLMRRYSIRDARSITDQKQVSHRLARELSAHHTKFSRLSSFWSDPMSFKA
jgi:hypothetical protein